MGNREKLHEAVAYQGAKLGIHHALLELSNSLDTVLETLIIFQPERAVSPLGNTSLLWLDAPIGPRAAANPQFYEARIPASQWCNGDPGLCRGSFLIQCSLVFQLQPLSFRTEQNNVTYDISLLSGKALTWATAQ